MRRGALLIPMLAIACVFAFFVGCAQMKSMANLPAWHPEELSAGEVSCSECHEDQEKGTMKPFSSFNHTPLFVKNHRFYAGSDERLCATCHRASFCTDCHTHKVEVKPSIKYGNRPDRQMPHRGDFLTLHKIEGKVDPASCHRCHGRANNARCIACHR